MQGLVKRGRGRFRLKELRDKRPGRRILICGGEGQMGVACTRALQADWDLAVLARRDLDITDRDAVMAVVAATRPDYIINCAAYTKVDRCETGAEEAWLVNDLGPRNLATAAAGHGSVLVHLSTDYVFDGLKPIPQSYTETDLPRPLSLYGRTKLAGEDAVRRTAPGHIIVRTAWLFGATGSNFLKTMLRLTLKEPGRRIEVVSDQFGCPTWTQDLAAQIRCLLEVGGQGTYHAVNEGFCTWYGLALFFLRCLGVPHNIVPCGTGDYPTTAVRPRNSVLENRRLTAARVNIMRPWQAAVAEFAASNREALLKEAQA